MIKVNGIAGVFLYANDPKTLAEWYTLHFGLDFLSDSANTYYMEFYYRDDTDTSRRWSTVFAIMPAKYPGSKGLFSWITDPEGNHLELYQPL